MNAQTVKLIFCGCKWCRVNKHRPSSRVMIKRVSRSARRKWNQLASTGNDELIGNAGVGYTD